MENVHADKVSKSQFFNYVNSLSGRDQLLSLICYWAAPTLLGLKPATLINLSGDLRCTWHSCRRDILSGLSLSCFELVTNPSHASLLLYHRELLEACLQLKGNRGLLERKGYPVLQLSSCLESFQKRCDKAFPHEIGCFLGIPCWDVQAFMEHHGRDYMLCGYWKVYSHLSYALETFRSYDRAHESMMVDKSTGHP